MEAPEKIKKKRGLSSDGARKVRSDGHADALEFAIKIGLTKDYTNDLKAKKDVVDPAGDAHSLKSGNKKWQIFLYGLGRFESDDAFAAMNGVGALLKECINAFPQKIVEYEKNKQKYKNALRPHMVSIKEKLSEKQRLRAFLSKSMFDGGQVDYLTVKHDGKYHVFLASEVVTILGDCLEIANSKAITVNQTPEQKVLLKYAGRNVGEIEMRNESEVHYREVRFNMIKPKIMALLFERIPFKSKFKPDVLVYGKASKRFGHWK